MLIANNQRSASCGGLCERDLCETTTGCDLATASDRQYSQASFPISLFWLALMAAEGSQSYRQPVSCRARRKTKNRPVCQSPSPSTMCPELAPCSPVFVQHTSACLIPASRVRSHLASQVPRGSGMPSFEDWYFIVFLLIRFRAINMVVPFRSEYA